MGVERAVTRWYVQRQTLHDQIMTLEDRLAQSTGEKQGPDVDSEREELACQLAYAQERLRLLGPCPKPMMG